MSHRPRRLRTGSVAAVSLIAGLLLVTTPGASANEPLPEGSATLQDFVAGSVPQWNFARANRNDHSERTTSVFGSKKILQTKLVFWATKPIKIEHGLSIP